MLDLVLLPFLFWLGLAGSIICTCFIVCSLIWLLHRDPGQVVVASTCGGMTWSATVGGHIHARLCPVGLGPVGSWINLPYWGWHQQGARPGVGGVMRSVSCWGQAGTVVKLTLSAKLSVNKQHSLYSCVVLYTMVVEPLTIVIFCLTKWVIVASQHGTYGCLVSLPWTRQRHWRTRLAGFSSFGPWLQTDNTFLRLSSKFACPPFPIFSLVGASAVALVRQWLRCDDIILPD